MTIGEVEKALNISRANVRFYESEGLISVDRGDNNYRQYSDSDVNELKKIVFLRSLDIGISDIKEIQNGQKSLESVLTAKVNEISQQKDQLEQITKICNYVIDNKIEYSHFYVESIEDGITLAFLNGRIKDDEINSLPYPIGRFFARVLDELLLSAVTMMILCLGFRVNISILNTIGSLVVGFVAEAILLSTVGTTFGKWVFGFKLRQKNGKKLTFFNALERHFYIIVYGYGWYIPLYSIYRLYRSYSMCSEEEELIWDEEFSYTKIERKIPQAVAALVGFATVIAIIIGTLGLVAAPKHLGFLSVEKFVDNYNTHVQMFTENDTEVLTVSGKYERIDFQGNIIVIGDQPQPLKFETKNGILTKVSLDYLVKGNESEIIFLPDFQVVQCFYSIIQAENLSQTFNSLSGVEVENIKELTKSFSFTTGSYKVTNICETNGLIPRFYFFTIDETANPDEIYLKYHFEIEKIK